MKHRRYRSNPVIRPSEAAALRALLSRHGYRVNARPNENEIETVRLTKRRNPKKKRKTTWRSRWKSRAEMEAYMAKIRRKAILSYKKRKGSRSPLAIRKRKLADARYFAAKRKLAKKVTTRRKTVKRRRVMKRKTAKHRARR